MTQKQTPIYSQPNTVSYMEHRCNNRCNYMEHRCNTTKHSELHGTPLQQPLQLHGTPIYSQPNTVSYMEHRCNDSQRDRAIEKRRRRSEEAEEERGSATAR